MTEKRYRHPDGYWLYLHPGGQWLPNSPDVNARERETQTIDVLLAYREWEANVITHANWNTSDGLPRLTQKQFDRMLEIQRMREALLEPVR